MMKNITSVYNSITGNINKGCKIIDINMDSLLNVSEALNIVSEVPVVKATDYRDAELATAKKAAIKRKTKK